MDRIEAEKLVADAIILERAARVLDCTSRRPFEFTSMHWLDVKDTLREVATAKRAEVDQWCGEVRDASQEGQPAG